MDIAAIFRAISLEDIEAEQARRMSLAEFVQRGWHVLEPTTPLVWGWHMQAICDHVQALLTGWRGSQNGGPPPAEQNLGICVPPGSSKSLIAAVFAPAWLWLNMPSARIIAISGNPRLVTKHSTACRDLIRSDWYQRTFRPRWSLKIDDDTKLKFSTSEQGFRSAFASGSKLTGDRGDVLLWDDLLDASDRHSSLAKATVRDWIDSTAYNRVNDANRSVRIAIQQRLATDDPVGHLLQKYGARWNWLMIPQEWEETARFKSWIGWTDPRTTDGELMDPVRFSPRVLEEAKISLGPSGYAAQHQQRPAPQEGALFKREWFRPYKRLPGGFDYILASWDTRNSLKDKEGTSYVCGVCIGVLGPDRYLLDVRRGRWTPLETEQRIEDSARAWAERFGTMRAVLVEEKASGPTAIERLRSRIPAVLGVNPRGDKVERAQWVSPTVQAGNVLVPESVSPGSWVFAFMDEILAFPYAANNDQVDAFTQAMQWLMANMAVDMRGVKLNAEAGRVTPRVNYL